MDISVIAGWVGDIFLTASLWEIGNRRRRGFLLCVIGELLWIWRAVSLHAYDLLVVCALFLLLNLRAYALWKIVKTQ